MDFTNIDLKNNMLIITNDDGSTTCIPEEGANETEKAMFAEFRAKYPLGKLNKLPLDELKAKRIQEMNLKCGGVIVNEFYSSCLGEKRRFDCEQLDQTSIQGLYAKALTIASGQQLEDTALDWKASGEPICYHWTPQQAIQLGLDLFKHVTTNKKRYEAIRQYILDVTDENLVLEVNWNMDIPEKYFSPLPQSTT